MNLLAMGGVWLAVLQGSAFCTSIYLHRYRTHRALELHPAVAFLMHLHLSLFTGIVPRQWAAVHRKHHHFSDKPGDPHSPYLYGLWSVLFGNYFYYRREANNPAVVARYTSDWKEDALDKVPFMNYAVFAGLGIFVLMFGAGLGVAAWLAHIVVYVLANASINSVCHMLGYRNFDNKATNVQSIALFTAGEGLHNNHHQYPSSPLFALRKREIDPSWPVIRMLERLGLATVKRVPAAKAA